MPRMATVAGVVAFVAAAHVAEAQRVLGTDLDVDLPLIARAPLTR